MAFIESSLKRIIFEPVGFYNSGALPNHDDLF